MADPIFEKAIAKRDAAQRIVDKWTTFIEAYRELTGDAHNAAVLKVPHHGRLTDRAMPRTRPDRRDLPVNSELGKTVAITDSVLNEIGHPLPLDTLFNEVTRRGFVVTGQKPKENYSARLYNSGRYRSLGKKEGWWFRDRPWPLSQEPPTGAGPSPGSAQQSDTTGGGQTLLTPAARLNGGVSTIALLSGEGAAMGH